MKKANLKVLSLAVVFSLISVGVSASTPMENVNETQTVQANVENFRKMHRLKMNISWLTMDTPLISGLPI